jgi:hypothetical protein
VRPGGARRQWLTTKEEGSEHPWAALHTLLIALLARCVVRELRLTTPRRSALTVQDAHRTRTPRTWRTPARVGWPARNPLAATPRRTQRAIAFQVQ